LPAIVKILAVFGFVLLLSRSRLHLGFSLLIGSLLLGFWSGQSLASLAGIVARSLIDRSTLLLAAILVLILFLSRLMERSGNLNRIVEAFSRVVRGRRALSALIPALVGIFPLPGGALFSAPLVGTTVQDTDLSSARKTVINYWFRHALEPIFPLYPSLVLAAGLMGVSVQTLTVTQWPLFGAALAGGLLFGLVGIHRALAPDGGRPGSKDTLILLARSIWPIVMVLALSILLGLDLILALLATVLALIVVHRLGPERLWSLARKTPLGTVPIIMGAMVFRQVLETSHAVEAISASLSGFGIPLALIAFTIPMLAGLLTGLLVAALAIGLPIVLPLCGPDAVASGYGLLAYAGGFAGMMLSPVHLCLSLTRVYFRADWGGIYQRLVPAVFLLALAAGVILLVR